MRTGRKLALCGFGAAATCIVGCTTPQLLSGSNQNRLLATVDVGDQVRATTRDGVGPQFEIAAIEAGGVLRGVAADGAAVQVLADDITELEYRKPAPAKTALFVLGVTLGVAALTAECESDGANEFYDPCN